MLITPYAHERRTLKVLERLPWAAFFSPKFDGRQRSLRFNQEKNWIVTKVWLARNQSGIFWTGNIQKIYRVSVFCKHFHNFFWAKLGFKIETANWSQESYQSNLNNITLKWGACRQYNTMINWWKSKKKVFQKTSFRGDEGSWWLGKSKKRWISKKSAPFLSKYEPSSPSISTSQQVF